MQNCCSLTEPKFPLRPEDNPHSINSGLSIYGGNDMLNPLFSLCVYLIEMVISYIFFASLSRPKRNSLRIILVGSLLFSCASGVNIIFRNNGLINGLTTLLINIVFSRSCFDCPLQKSFFYTAILAVLNVALEVAIISASSYIAGDSFSGYNSNFLLLIFQALTIKTL